MQIILNISDSNQERNRTIENGAWPTIEKTPDADNDNYNSDDEDEADEGHYCNVSLQRLHAVKPKL